MKVLIRRAAASILSVFAVGAMTIASFSAMDQARTLAQTQALIAGWPARSRHAAGALLEKYGAPDSAMADGLTWRRRGDWERVEVHRDEAPATRLGLIENVVRYDAPAGSWRDIYMMDLGVSYEPIGKLLSAASRSEETNTLALNVAFDVISGRRSFEDARVFYKRTTRLALAGKSSTYTRGLLFKPAQAERRRQPGQLWPLP
jgi:hypothetical protein